MRYGDTACTSEGDLGGLPDIVEETLPPTTIRHNRGVKYRTRIEKWIVESISNQYDYDGPAYPGKLLDTVYDFEDRITRVLADLSDDELVDMFYQHSCGYTFEELEEDIEYEFMQEYITCIITRADRIRLEGVDKNKSTMKNFKTVMDLYDRSLEVMKDDNM